MSIGQWILRVTVVTVILGAGLLLTPDFKIAPDCSTQAALTCTGADYDTPDEFWLPLVAVLNLNEYVPTWAMLAIVSFDLTMRAAMVTWWLVSWVWNKVSP